MPAKRFVVFDHLGNLEATMAHLYLYYSGIKAPYVRAGNNEHNSTSDKSIECSIAKHLLAQVEQAADKHPCRKQFSQYASGLTTLKMASG